jgi:hypothetical protein
MFVKKGIFGLEYSLGGEIVLLKPGKLIPENRPRIER